MSTPLPAAASTRTPATWREGVRILRFAVHREGEPGGDGRRRACSCKNTTRRSHSAALACTEYDCSVSRQDSISPSSRESARDHDHPIRRVDWLIPSPHCPFTRGSLRAYVQLRALQLTPCARLATKGVCRRVGVRRVRRDATRRFERGESQAAIVCACPAGAMASASAAETIEALAAKLLVMGFDGAGEQPPEHARRLIRAGASLSTAAVVRVFSLVAPGRHRLEGSAPRRRVQCSVRTHPPVCPSNARRRAVRRHAERALRH